MKLIKQHKDILSTLLNQLWRLISGPLTLLLIPIFLSPVNQGYWYLFASLSALSVFADLGFSNIIMQFSAHQYANLSFNNEGLLVGDPFYLHKMGSFFRFTLKWIFKICFLVFPVIYSIGILFFLRDGVFNAYIYPWTVYLIGSLLNFLCYAILSYLEGMNRISKIQNIRLKVAVINTAVTAAVLMFGGGIYALAAGSFLSGLSLIIFVYIYFQGVLTQVLNISKNSTYDWYKEVMPLFIKYALSFSSGYFIFSVYTPLMQYYHGPIQSGKVGITLTLVTTVFGLSNIWIYTIIPRMNILVSKNDKIALDLIFNRRLWFAVVTYLLISFCLLLFYLLFKDFQVISRILSRFLSLPEILMLSTCYLFQLIINSWATYLRAHKKEPYMIPSMILALWISLFTAYAGYNLSSSYFFVGFLSSYLWWLPVAFLIYKRCQKDWYEK